MNAYETYTQHLFARANMQGLPLSGTFELTPRCNFRCKMCYIHREENDAQARCAERSAAQWLSLAEECCREGTLLLLLTGGEPTVRPDFREIYSGCKRMGLMLSVNTNASLIDDNMVDFLAANPPRRVNITLYGASSETYGTLCGNAAAYDRVVRAILNLQSAGVLVKLNFSVTPYNRRDAQAVYDFAAEHQLPLHGGRAAHTLADLSFRRQRPRSRQRMSGASDAEAPLPRREQHVLGHVGSSAPPVRHDDRSQRQPRRRLLR